MTKDFVASFSALSVEASKLGFRIKVDGSSLETEPLKPIDLNPGFHLQHHVNSPLLSDIELVINGRTYFAHKMTLSASSKYFEAMFHSGFKESDDFIVQLDLPVDLSYEEMMLLLDFMYTGSRKRILEDVQRSQLTNKSSLLNVLMVAEYLQLDTLLVVLYDEIFRLGPSRFTSQVNWKPDTVISQEIIETLLRMVAPPNTVHAMLKWIELATQTSLREHGWNTTLAGSKQITDLIDKYVAPQCINISFMDLKSSLIGLSPEVIAHISSKVFLPLVMGYKPTCAKETCVNYVAPKTDCLCSRDSSPPFSFPAAGLFALPVSIGSVDSSRVAARNPVSTAPVLRGPFATPRTSSVSLGRERFAVPAPNRAPLTFASIGSSSAPAAPNAVVVPSALPAPNSVVVPNSVAPPQALFGGGQ